MPRLFKHLQSLTAAKATHGRDGIERLAREHYGVLFFSSIELREAVLHSPISEQVRYRPIVHPHSTNHAHACTHSLVIHCSCGALHGVPVASRRSISGQQSAKCSRFCDTAGIHRYVHRDACLPSILSIVPLAAFLVLVDRMRYQMPSAMWMISTKRD